MTNLENVLTIPVRHHSPRTSICLSEIIQRLRPKHILIEGPSDANDLIPYAVDVRTVPPVAILSYTQQSDATDYLVYPFADYSPEYVALKEGTNMGAEVSFFDIPSGEFLSRKRTYEQVEKETVSIYEEVSGSLGYRSFDEFWEANFESRQIDADRYFELMREFGILARSSDLPDDESRKLNRIREGFMISRLVSLVERAKGDQILVVWGAYHDAGFVSGDYDLNLVTEVGEYSQVTCTLIPYSFLRLSEQSGYGAGNRAPFFYQSVYQKQGSFHRATLEVLTEFSKNLRLRGYMASMSDTIEAYRLTRVLSQMRDKEAPGIDEIREATIACLMHGASKGIEDFLWNYVVGRNIGTVSEGLGKNSLQIEFYKELKARKLPLEDEVSQFILTLTNDIEIGTSVFLHRLRLAEVPYGNLVADTARRGDGLTTLKEKWEVRWSPSVDLALLEKIVLGGGFAEVCARTLVLQIQSCNSLHQSTGVLTDAILTHTLTVVDRALELIDVQSNVDEDFYHLAAAANHLLAILSYSNARELDPTRFAFLLDKIYTRAVLSLNQNADCSDEASHLILEGMKILNDVSQRDSRLDRLLYITELTRIASSFSAHQRISGLALGLLSLDKAISEDELERQVSLRLSYGTAPLQAANFLEGFLSINKIVFVKNQALVGWMNQFIGEIPPDDLVHLLPVLRKCFDDISSAEMSYLVENIASVLGITDLTLVSHTLTEQSAEELGAIDKDLGSMMDDLDKLF